MSLSALVESLQTKNDFTLEEYILFTCTITSVFIIMCSFLYQPFPVDKKFLALIPLILLPVIVLSGWNCSYFLASIGCGFLIWACYYIFPYSDIEIALSQNPDKSIGASWAIGAKNSYYDVIFKDWPKRLKEFEKEHDITVTFRKFIVICPLSCNMHGCLEDKGINIKKTGREMFKEHDQGGTINRIYKNTLYSIGDKDPLFFFAELASPLGTLENCRSSLNKDIFIYHRQCFIRKIKDLLKNYPCVILEYDDENPNCSKSLDELLLSKLKQL